MPNPTDAKPTLYERLLAAGVQMDHHESDLLVARTPEAERIIAEYRAEGNVTNERGFPSSLDGSPWIDIPFHYTPWWEARRTSEQP